jgi:hypothetical protein
MESAKDRAHAWIVAIAEAAVTTFMAAVLAYLPLSPLTATPGAIAERASASGQPATPEVAARGIAVAEATLAAFAQRALVDTFEMSALEVEVDANETVRVRVGFERRDARGPSGVHARLFGKETSAPDNESSQ